MPNYNYYTVMTRRSTGNIELDRNLNGGIPTGSLVVIRTDPSTQGEVILKQLTQQHSTLYLSTLRTEPDIENWLDTPPGQARVEYTAMDTPIEKVKENIGMVNEQVNIILDPINPLENEDYSKYVTMLQSFKTHLENTDSIGIVHMLKNGDGPDHRSNTLAMADMVWDLDQELKGEELETRLKVTKCRSGVLPDKVSKVDLRDRVIIDTSRDIA